MNPFGIHHCRRLRIHVLLVMALGMLVVAVRPALGLERATLRVGRDAATVQSAVDRARVGDIIEIPDGVWHGSVVIEKPVVLRGVGGTIDGDGTGRALQVDAPDTVIENLRVRGSGRNLSSPDACIYVSKAAEGTIIRDNELSDCAFGMWIHEARDVQITGNRVIGSESGHRSNRGNGIQLFNAEHLLVRDNVVTGGRDGIYVSATENSRIIGNRVERSRYGVHYMFSYHNVVRANVCRGNGSGYAIMESHYIDVSGNVAEDNEEHGILFRDVQYSEIRDNDLRGNHHGLFFYSSTENVIAGNQVRGNEVGAKIWAGSVRNRVTRNVFVGNRKPIFYVGTKDLVWGKEQAGNVWGDYLGWDQDGDGLGDRPYRVDSFSTNLTHRYPSAVLLLRSPSLELLSHLERHMPMLEVPTVIDMKPQMGAGR